MVQKINSGIEINTVTIKNCIFIEHVLKIMANEQNEVLTKDNILPPVYMGKGI